MKLHQLGNILALSWHIVDQLGAISTLAPPWLHLCPAFGLVCPNLAPSWRPGRSQTKANHPTKPNQPEPSPGQGQTKANQAKPRQTKPSPSPSQSQANPNTNPNQVTTQAKPSKRTSLLPSCYRLGAILGRTGTLLAPSGRHLDTILIRLAIFAKLGAIVAPAPKPNQGKPHPNQGKPKPSQPTSPNQGKPSPNQGQTKSN